MVLSMKVSHNELNQCAIVLSGIKENSMLRKKVLCVVSCLMVLFLLIVSSCGGSEAEEKEEQGVLSSEIPKYGGTLQIIGSDPSSFDEALALKFMARTTYQTNDSLIGGDYYKGPSGTGETDWVSGACGNMDVLTGYVAEKWELVGDDTIIYHIRPGIHFHNKPPTNGRELTAEDVVFSLNRLWFESDKTLHAMTPPFLKPTSITATGKYTVEVKVPPARQATLLLEMGVDGIYPKDAIEQFGDMSDWKNVIGAGPWMIEEYVPSSYLKFVRNPDYYMTDPKHPENRLPYIDSMRVRVIQDASTQQAAMNTGQLDYLDIVDFESLTSLTKNNKDILYKARMNAPLNVYFTMDNPESPWADINVRRAMNIAINKQEIIDDLFSGNGYMLANPYHRYASQAAFYTPLNEQPESVQELFEYNPEKAKTLLAGAGYPDGFTTEVVCQQGVYRGMNMVDYLSVIAAAWEKIGVTVKINALDSSIFGSMKNGRTFEDAILSDYQGYSAPFVFLAYIENFSNLNKYVDPVLLDYQTKMQQILYKDVGEMNRILKESGPYILDQAFALWMPALDVFTVWQPWLQNYNGEVWGGVATPQEWARFIWMDVELANRTGD